MHVEDLYLQIRSHIHTSIDSTGGADSSFFLDLACALAVTDRMAVLT